VVGWFLVIHFAAVACWGGKGVRDTQRLAVVVPGGLGGGFTIRQHGVDSPAGVAVCCRPFARDGGEKR
jgi:hypothetical protein